MLECFNDCHWKTVSVDYFFNVCVSMCENAYTTFSTFFFLQIILRVKITRISFDYQIEKI